MVPLVHAPCTLVKLHGDYLDARIKNTIEELEDYDPRMDRLLDQVLDEYGLVVCGWSGDWDSALRRGFERAKGRRYTTYWASRGEPGGRAKALIEFRKAQVIPIDGADGFFGKLTEKVKVLDEFARPHPLSTAAAVAALKRYLPDLGNRIRLEDLVTSEVDKTLTRVADTHVSESGMTFEVIAERAGRIESLSETIMTLFAAGGYYGGDKDSIWSWAVDRLVKQDVSHWDEWTRLRLYPGLLCVYAGGLAAVATGRYGFLKAIWAEDRIDVGYGERVRRVYLLNPQRVFHPAAANAFYKPQNKYVPVSERLFEVLRPVLRPYIPSDRQYDQVFDRFEYFRCLVTQDQAEPSSPGRFWCKHMSGFRLQDGIIQEVDEEAAKVGSNWPPLRAGLFGGARDRFIAARDAVVSQVERSGMV